MNFNTFSDFSGVADNNRRLAPWNIYKVKFAGARKETFEGKAHPGETYEVLKLRFEGDEGYYEESIFYPNDSDFDRPTYTNREGHEYQGASNWERIQTLLAQVGTVLNKEGFEKFQEVSRKGSFKSFDQVVKAFIKVTESAIGKETNLKLVGRTDKNGNVNPALPKFVAVNKEGKLFVSCNFIGDNLYFTPYEERQRKTALEAKPTTMPDDNGIDTAEKTEDLDDLDFNL